MTGPHEDEGARLERLRAATEPVRPRAGFDARVAAAIERDVPPGAWMGELPAAARRLWPVAVVAAAVCAGWAVQSERIWDAAASTTTASEAAGEW
jgi:hypothetical protein